MLNMVSDGVSSIVSGLAWIRVEIFAQCLDNFGGRDGPRTKIVIIGGLRCSDMRCMPRAWHVHANYCGIRWSDMRCIHATCMACACPAVK